MNYAAAFATALNEHLDERGIKRQGPYGVQRPDPGRVDAVRFEGDEGYHYSEYTNADPSASLIFTGGDAEAVYAGKAPSSTLYGCHIDAHMVGDLDIGKLIERAVEIMKEA